MFSGRALRPQPPGDSILAGIVLAASVASAASAVAEVVIARLAATVPEADHLVVAAVATFLLARMIDVSVTMIVAIVIAAGALKATGTVR